MTVQPIFVTLSRNAQGGLDYNPVTSVLLSELAKLLISATLLQTSGDLPSVKPEAREALRFSAPAIIYFLNNNLVFFILTHISATTFQLMSQLKTVFTALLFRFFLTRKLTVMQYLSILQLALGAATSHIPRCFAGSSQSPDWTGSAMMVCSCFFSATGGLYSERLLKDKAKDSIHWQNCQMYFWGVLFNFAGALLQEGSIFERGFFSGYNAWTWAVVVNSALNGLAISAILKYADNIARIFAHAASMVLTMLISIALFDEVMTPQVVIAVVAVGTSTLQYNLKPEHLFEAPPTPAVLGAAAGKVESHAESEEDALLAEEDEEDEEQGGAVHAKLIRSFP